MKNAGRKLYFLTQLKRARVTPQDLVAFYCTCVRSSLDYACAVFHFSLPQYLQTELERIQKRALFTIYPGLSYAEALVEAGIESIQDHQRQLSINLFCAISENPDNKLNKLVPPIITPNYNLRKTRKFRVLVAKTVAVTEKAKLLGVIINNSLTWNDHVEELVKNAGRKLYFLTQLKRARVTPQDLVAFYCACVRSSLNYACAVFHFSLPQYLQTELERIQKRALFTIYPGLSYAEALVEAGIESIQDHQRQLSINLFCAISENPDNKLNKLVPPIITPNYNLRKTRKFRVPVAKTKRFAESFIMKGAQLA